VTSPVQHIGQDQVLMTVDSKYGTADRMVPSQVVTTSSGSQHSRAQDAIASILASMNTQVLDTAGTAANPVNYSTAVQEVDEMVSLDPQQFEAERQEVLPLNLATTDSSSQGTVIQTSQGLQIQGVKRPVLSSPTMGTKKVIIATINGKQRILTPVSSPQIIAMKSSSPRYYSDGTVLNGSGPILIQKPVTTINKPKQLNSPVMNSRTTDNKTCLWKFENGQVCGKVFTKTYNLTVHMRMHQDIRPFPCTVCEQTFRQKAHLQRHEATHGIDSTANRKRRKRPLMEEMNEMNKRADGEEELYRSFGEKRRLGIGLMKSEEEEEEMDVDPMIEPIEGSQLERKIVVPVNVGTNTEVTRHDVTDEIDQSSLEPRRYRPNTVSKGVEQGVQYSEEDLIIPESNFQYVRDDTLEEKSMVARFVQTNKPEMKTEEGEAVEGGTVEVAAHEAEYSSQHYVTTVQPDIGESQLIAQTEDGSYIDTSANQIVMSHEGELVGFVPVEGDQSQVVNISTTTNEQGQQVVIIENLHHHSPEFQREIMNALISENNLVPLTQS